MGLVKRVIQLICANDLNMTAITGVQALIYEHSFYFSDIQLLHKSPHTFIAPLEKGTYDKSYYSTVWTESSLLQAVKNCSGTRKWIDGQTGYLGEVCIELGGKLVSHLSCLPVSLH